MFICYKFSNDLYRPKRKHFRMMEIQCPNPKCHADNPANAKFCRKCGTAFTPINKYKQMLSSVIGKFFLKRTATSTSTFTLDTFCNITFQPVSVVKIRFVDRFVVFLFILFAALWLATITGLTGDVLYALDDGFYEDVFIHYEKIVGVVSFAITGLCVLFIIKWWVKMLLYKFNAAYIEDQFVNSDVVRIARKSRMGLFDKSKNKVLLPSSYSNIEKFDNQHLLISKGNKKGLYSLTYRKIIIPVMFDSISKFTNSVTIATIQGTGHHYDVKGNELR